MPAKVETLRAWNCWNFAFESWLRGLGYALSAAVGWRLVVGDICDGHINGAGADYGQQRRIHSLPLGHQQDSTTAVIASDIGKLAPAMIASAVFRGVCKREASGVLYAGKGIARLDYDDRAKVTYLTFGIGESITVED
jgi:hypothetical protein